MINNIITTLAELKGEPGISKNIKMHIEHIMANLQSDAELGKDKALAEIEEMVAENNIEQHIRTQIWTVVSMLESI